MKMTIEDVKWKRDRITARWIENNREKLKSLRRMKPARLAEACTFCETIENPFALELVRRAKMEAAFLRSQTPADKRKVLDAAAGVFGIRLY